MHFLLRDFEKLVCVVLFLAMTALGFVNIVIRYATNYSFAASEELLTNGFLLLTIFGAAVAARRGEHLAVTVVTQLFPPRLRRLAFVVAGIVAVFLLALSVWFTARLVQNQVSSGITSYALQVPVWYYSIGVPVGFAMVLIRHVQFTLESLRAGDYDRGETPDV